LDFLDGISSAVVYLPMDLMSQDKRNALNNSLRAVEQQFPDGIPPLDPIEDMHIEDETFKKILRSIESIEDKLLRNPKFKEKDIGDLFQLYQKRVMYEQEIKKNKRELQRGKDVILKAELKSMKRVLKRLGFITADGVIDVKGRVACEINANDELVLTELLFSGFFNSLDVEMIPTLLSSFVWEDEKVKQVPLRTEIQAPFKQLQEIARKVAEVSKECKLEIEVEEYVKRFKADIMEIIYDWCKGASFAEICKKNNSIYEGSLIRAMRRLDELLRQLIIASISIGNKELEERVVAAQAKLKRDIVFAASLYL